MESKPTVALDPTLTLAPDSRPAPALHSELGLALHSERTVAIQARPTGTCQAEPTVALQAEPALALGDVPDDELLRRLDELVRQSRRVEADLVAHIGEVDERRLFARQAFPSMFVYCTQALHLSEAEAYRRITVARAARRHPGLLAMLRDGRLHLTGMALLVPLLTPQNRDSVLARATHRSKREIEELVAELMPRPDVPSAMRKLPDRRRGPVTQGAPSTLTAESTVGPALSPRAELFPGRVGVVARSQVNAAPAGCGASAAPVDCVASGQAASPVGSVAPAVSAAGVGPEASLALRRPTRPRPTVVEPLSPARYKVQFTASAELHDKLERLQALMRSQVKDGDLGAIIELAVTQTLERLEAKRFAKAAAPRKTLSETDTAPATRHIPAAVRRAVRKRDQGRCRFVDEQGRRCSERHRLEFHHRHPFGMGGDHSPGNISLMCAAHNRYLAEHDYGQSATRHRLRKEKAPPGPAPRPEGSAPFSTRWPRERLDRVHSRLADAALREACGPAHPRAEARGHLGGW